jgi:hypothetical protein
MRLLELPRRSGGDRVMPFRLASVDVPMIMLRMLELERSCLVITADTVQVCASFRTIVGLYVVTHTLLLNPTV